MKYCQRCITPDTRPHLVLDSNGVCNACHAHANRPTIDWAARAKQFSTLSAQVKKRGAAYDCVIPVSGGKDSTWQVVKCLEHGLHPLSVTWKTPGRTPLGEKNLANLIRLGIDHIDFQINPRVEKKFMRQAFIKMGSTAIPMHLAIFNIPVGIASKFDIPLIVWGENSATEYGGSDDDQKTFRLDSAWLKKYGVTHGTTAKDWVSADITAQELTPYFGPSDADLAQKKIEAVFLGQFFPWDPEVSLKTATANGFESSKQGPRTGYYSYAYIDDDFISLHHYLKWHKFGFTRLFDNLSLEIRNGRMSREQAIDIVTKTGDQTPHSDIDKFCAFVGMTVSEFHRIANGFRNKQIWFCENGHWKMNGFLVKGWKWNETC